MRSLFPTGLSRWEIYWKQKRDDSESDTEFSSPNYNKIPQTVLSMELPSVNCSNDIHEPDLYIKDGHIPYIQRQFTSYITPSFSLERNCLT